MLRSRPALLTPATAACATALQVRMACVGFASFALARGGNFSVPWKLKLMKLVKLPSRFTRLARRAYRDAETEPAMK